MSGAIALAIPLALALAADDRVASVGMPGRIRELVLPGTVLEAKPADLAAPIVLRVASVAPHGTAFRYDLVWYGLEPGAFDLRDWLRRADGSPIEDVPPIPVQVTSLLPPGQVLPTEPPLRAVSGLGGYRALLISGAIAWIAALAALIATRRRRARAADGDGASSAIPLEERLRALVDEALRARADGAELPSRKRAELELTLLEHWRRKLDLRGLAPAEAFQELKRRPESRPAILQLEEWLHRPVAPGSRPEFDVRALLEPYRTETAPTSTSKAASWNR